MLDVKQHFYYYIKWEDNHQFFFSLATPQIKFLSAQ